MENTIENAKQFVYDNSNFNTDLGMGYIMAKMCVDYANKLNKPCVSTRIEDWKVGMVCKHCNKTIDSLPIVNGLHPQCNTELYGC